MLFMEFLGNNQVPFVRVFTKTDKLSSADLEKSIHNYDLEMLKIWESLPATFLASVVKRTGREEILNFIEETINNFSNTV
jgi:GTP-binding protein